MVNVDIVKTLNNYELMTDQNRDLNLIIFFSVSIFIDVPKPRQTSIVSTQVRRHPHQIHPFPVQGNFLLQRIKTLAQIGPLATLRRKWKAAQVLRQRIECALWPEALRHRMIARRHLMIARHHLVIVRRHLVIARLRQQIRQPRPPILPPLMYPIN